MSEYQYRSPTLKSLTLGGFQVFDQRVTIPLHKLTLLYGPNSSGKSAIEDALSMLHTLVAVRGMACGKGIRIVGEHASAFERQVRTHWRRVPGRLPDRAPEMLIGVGIEKSLDVPGYLRQVFLPTVEQSPSVEMPGLLDLHFRFINEDQGASDDLSENYEIAAKFFEIELEISVDGIPLVQLVCLQSNTAYQINADHPSVKKCNNLISMLDGIGFRSIPATNWYGTEIRGDYPSPAAAKLDEFVSLLTNSLMMVFLPNKTSASRNVPTEEQLTFLFEDLDSTVYPEDQVPSLQGFSIGTQGDTAFAQLAASIRNTLTPWKVWFEDDEDGDNDDEYSAIGYGVELANVNRMLSDCLFTERGYQVAFDYRVLLSGEQFSKATSESGLSRRGRASCGREIDESRPGAFPLLIRIFLIDETGRRLAFTDVGSGLGYVMPVLISCFTDTVGGSGCLIQQPELHLHPALQSELGDVFIYASRQKSPLIIETHSEHLLLRLLRRIRQTHEGTLADAELSLSADDLAVLYFDPAPNGTTQVKELRVTDDGDFLDEWPRGFFTERLSELFDE